jgi:hypothetical protein
MITFVFVIFYVSLSAYGYYAVYVAATGTAVMLTFLNVRSFNSNLILLYLVIFLIIFDNEKLNFTSFKLRMWYFPYLFLAGRLLIENKMFLKIRISSRLYAISLLFFVIYFLAFLMLEDIITKLYIAKYLIFNILFVIVVVSVVVRARNNIDDILFFFYWVISFVVFWGIFQSLQNISGGGEVYQHDWYNLSPSAFFDERTWFGQYASIGLINSIYYLQKKRRIIYAAVAALCIFALILSFSRSAIIPLLGGIICMCFVKIRRQDLPKTIYLYLIIMIFGWIALGSIFDKFNFSEIGVISRLDAIKISFSNIIANPVDYLLGNGFSYSQESTEGGTALGAKAANYLFMVVHIFGYCGFLLAAMLTINVFIRFVNCLRVTRSNLILMPFCFFVSFIALSLVVPAFQYPPMLILLGLSLGVLISEEKIRR